MKERPILFSGLMVRAILEGRKTQTRRVIKEQPPERYKDLYYECNWHGKVGPVGWFWSRSTSGAGAEQQDLLGINPCPYGTVGDRLWVREAWLPLDADHVIGDVKCAYRADVTPDGEEIRLEYIKRGRRYQWRPSIHMPRWASRITLEITGVRAERLQDISEKDARSEGVDTMRDMRFAAALGNLHSGACRLNFIDLWQSINGPESWSANPWVWVIEFRRITE